jgi:hypothetical protein
LQRFLAQRRKMGLEPILKFGQRLERLPAGQRTDPAHEVWKASPLVGPLSSTLVAKNNWRTAANTNRGMAATAPHGGAGARKMAHRNRATTTGQELP